MKRKIDKLLELRAKAQGLIEKLNSQIDAAAEARDEISETVSELDRLIWIEMEKGETASVQKD